MWVRNAFTSHGTAFASFIAGADWELEGTSTSAGGKAATARQRGATVMSSLIFCGVVLTVSYRIEDKKDGKYKIDLK